MHKHATVSAWQREHDGSYKAEVGGWQLVVRWRPESPHQRRGFYWEAEQPALAERARATEVQEEIEVAMAEAEEFAAGGPTDAIRPS
jgi:hypothetical protein